MIQQLGRRQTHDWRPQAFGRGDVRRVPDPIIEPLWIGRRALAHVDGSTVAIVDAEGVELGSPTSGHADAWEEAERLEIEAVRSAIRDAVRAGSLVLDGYLTRQATAPPRGGLPGEVETPSAIDMTTQMLLGRRGDRGQIVAETKAIEAVEMSDAPLAFVAVDLLEIDDSVLLDVPLLERKRLLESAVEPGQLVRIGPYVRPPIGTWLATWRALGFVSIAYKSSNGRYLPGDRNAGWVLARIPKL